jgi:hypothetical protein
MIRSAVHKNDFGTSEDEGICGGDKGEAWHNHLIAGFYIQQNCRHLQRICTAGGEEAFLKPISILKKLLAPSGKFTVSGDFTKVYCFPDIIKFETCEVGFVEGDAVSQWVIGNCCELSVVSCQLSVVGCRLSVIGYRLSVIGYQ